MIYILLFVLLLAAEIFYFKIADKYNIIDKPNERSSHTQITLRGGGIIFYLGVIAFFIYSGFEYPLFFLGLTLMTIISFLDDMYSISNRLRILIHLFSVCLLFLELGMFGYAWWILVVSLIVVIGTINAYNFMDGINGITAVYSLAVLVLLALANITFAFIDADLIYFSMIATLVFGFFNFRHKAKCFAGDVGSVSMSFILIFLTLALIIASGNFIYIMFFAVYGIDTVWTIIQRLSRKENIFEAHRSHLYQYLSNEGGKNKLVVSASYGLLQLLIGLVVLKIATLETTQQLILSIALILMLSLVYLVFKRSIIKKYGIGK